MLKETVTYKDFDGNTQVETLYFNIAKHEMFELMELEPILRKLSADFSGPDRDLEVPEILEIVGLIKKLVKLSYGLRTDDTHFRKSAQILDDFESSAAYEAFIFGMFEEPQKAITFMTGIIPEGFVDADSVAEATAILNGTSVETVELPASDGSAELSATQAEVPAWVREDRDPTAEEMRHASREEMMLAFQRKNRKYSE